MSECGKKSFAQRFGKYEKVIMHLQEILLFKRPIALVLLLAYIIGFFIFAYGTGAGFFASLLLF